MTKLLSSKIGISCYSLSIQHVRLHINGPGRKLALRYYELSLFSTPLDAVTGRYFVWGFSISFFYAAKFTLYASSFIMIA